MEESISFFIYFLFFTIIIVFIIQNTRLVEIKQTEEVRKNEYSAQIETKLITAEQKREEELKKKLDAAKKYVNNYSFHTLIQFKFVGLILNVIVN